MINFFFLFFFIIFTCIFIVISKNIVGSLIGLICLFIFSSFLFFILGAEFLSFILLIVYAGAVCILFLFIVMLLNVRTVEFFIKRDLIFLIFFILVFLVFIFFYSNFFEKVSLGFIILYNNFFFFFEQIFFFDNLRSLGIVLFNFYGTYVLIVSFILFISILGCIYLIKNINYSFLFIYNKF